MGRHRGDQRRLAHPRRRAREPRSARRLPRRAAGPDRHVPGRRAHLGRDYAPPPRPLRPTVAEALAAAPRALPCAARGATRSRGRLDDPGQPLADARCRPFRLTPVPSHDWRGDDQVAWIIEADDRRVIHCGDTIWHGHWYEIARRFAPIDIALLPINGVVVQLDGFTPTEVPATLTPEQAVEAAIVLQARVACAIHHGLFHNPPLYTEQDDAVERFAAAARRRGIHAVAPVDGAPVPTA
jgi:Beta-lactamase superfamily domain